MNTDELEQLFSDWSATRPDLIHSAWDLTNSVQLLKWALSTGRLTVGSKLPSSVKEVN